MSTQEYAELESTIYDLCQSYLEINILDLCHHDFHDKLVDHIAYELFDDCLCAGILEADMETAQNDPLFVADLFTDFRLDIEAHVKEYMRLIEFKRRSYKYPKPHHYVNMPVEQMDARLNKVVNAYQPAQRTPEWYVFRHGLISASNIWKAVGSEANKNSLICEKCKPLAIRERSASVDDGLDEEPINGPSVNTLSTLHWGVKYEPLTAMIYEARNNINLGEFGCIQHSKYPYIGASPDGIVMTRESPLYGRMVEIKNVVNREVNGVPSMPYWVQMQVQMEVCDLEECDFVESVFKEYDDMEEEKFYQDSYKYMYNGLILYFIKRDLTDSSPKYVYMPLSIPLEKPAVDAWVNEQKQAIKDDYVLFRRIYWYCTTYSCVLVHRCREWFAAAQPKVDEIWRIIEKERVTGCEHRRPAPRPPKPPKCLMNLGDLE